MKLRGVDMGWLAYWEANDHAPAKAHWKEAIVECSLHEPGKPVFESREALQNCFATAFAESPWGFHGPFKECRRQGDPPIVLCDPDAKIRDSSNATATFDGTGRLVISDASGNAIGALPPESTILTLYLSGRVVRQTVAELDRRRNLDEVDSY